MSPIDSRSTAAVRLNEEQVYAAIADVLDPELDESLVKLGFIDQVQVDGTDVTVAFKLPTYWCSPNFAYLMASDLYTCVRNLPGVRTVHIVLSDHFAGEEIMAGVNQEATFAKAFAGEVLEDADLEELRAIFLRKGFLMRQDRVIRLLLKSGLDEACILNLRLTDVVMNGDEQHVSLRTAQGAIHLAEVFQQMDSYLRKGRALGLFNAQDSHLIIDEKGEIPQVGMLKDYLRRSRSVRMNILFNTSMCKGLFRTRYENAGASEAHQDIEGDIL